MGRFAIDPLSGDITIVGRIPFDSLVPQQYSLAISAQNIGAANKTATPTQTVYVQVDIKSPQFWYQPYIVNVNETTAVGSR